ncbi:hypothetical protein [Methylobacterium sp. 391_Methyba4]|uniref:hypothetical protein n=1 Tax=Methylobacterium sp. 391_Methyba4 TaxID=3038924 RepID=UPI00241CCF83|nr:hypothetical protein [Methylobacterium sp. 391_Methyba4]WFS07675.1 hypothetical protein P9K36_30740 [Methylobacterium sp. 391_Methyba4]
MPGYSDTELIRARRTLTDSFERGQAYCTLGHLEAEQREAATSERAEIIRQIQANIATFDGVEPEAEDAPTSPAPAPAPEPAAGSPTPAPMPPAPPAPAPAAIDTRALGAASMRRTLARSGITPVGEQPAPAGSSDCIRTSTTSMQRTLARMGVRPSGNA